MLTASVDLRQLSYFVAAAEGGSLSRAAVALAMTQSGLSRQISALESELSLRLFRRTGHGLALTDVGRALLPEAQAVLARAAVLRARAAELHTEPAGRVALAVTPLAAHALIAPVLAATRARWPRIGVEVMEAGSATVAGWLAEGRADLAVTYAPPEQFGPKLDGEKLFADPLCLVGRDGPAAPAMLAELGGQPLILPSLRNGMRRVLDGYAQRAGVVLDVAVEVDSTVATIEAVSLGLGRTVLPARGLAQELRAHGLVARPIVDPPLLSWLSAYVARSRAAVPAVAVVLQAVRERARGLADAAC